MSRAHGQDQKLTVRISEDDLLRATLLDMFRLVNDWLKFAEAKNGGVIGLASAALAIFLSYLAGIESNSSIIDSLFLVGGSCLLLSVLLGMASSLPQTDLLRLKSRRRGKPTRSDNLFYFGHVAKYSPRHLADEIAERYVAAQDTSVEEVHLALASQVVVNARITLWKLRLFSAAGVLFGVGILVCAIGVIAERA